MSDSLPVAPEQAAPAAAEQEQAAQQPAQPSRAERFERFRAEAEKKAEAEAVNPSKAEAAKAEPEKPAEEVVTTDKLIALKRQKHKLAERERKLEAERAEIEKQRAEIAELRTLKEQNKYELLKKLGMTPKEIAYAMANEPAEPDPVQQELQALKAFKEKYEAEQAERQKAEQEAKAKTEKEAAEKQQQETVVNLYKQAATDNGAYSYIDLLLSAEEYTEADLVADTLRIATKLYEESGEDPDNHAVFSALNQYCKNYLDKQQERVSKLFKTPPVNSRVPEREAGSSKSMKHGGQHSAPQTLSNEDVSEKSASKGPLSREERLAKWGVATPRRKSSNAN